MIDRLESMPRTRSGGWGFGLIVIFRRGWCEGGVRVVGVGRLKLERSLNLSIGDRCGEKGSGKRCDGDGVRGRDGCWMVEKKGDMFSTFMPAFFEERAGYGDWGAGLEGGRGRCWDFWVSCMLVF